MEKLRIQGFAKSNDYYINHDLADYLRNHSDVRAVDKVGTVLRFLEILKNYVDKIEGITNKPCFEVAYGNEHNEEYRLKYFSSWNEMIAALYCYSVPMVDDYLHENDNFSEYKINSAIKTMSKHLDSVDNDDCYIHYIKEVPDIERKRRVFLKFVDVKEETENNQNKNKRNLS